MRNHTIFLLFAMPGSTSWHIKYKLLKNTDTFIHKVLYVIHLRKYVKIRSIGLNKLQATCFIIFIILAIVISEYIFTYSGASEGIILCLGLTLLIYITISVINMDQGFIISAESLAIIPLYVLFTSSLPWFFINQQFLLPAVYSIILALCFWHMHEHNISPESVGLKGNNFLKYAIVGVLIGFCTGPIEYWVLHPAPSFPTFELKYLLRDLVYMTFFVGLGEELLFRGLIQNDLINMFGTKTGIVGQAFLFSVMHITWRSPLELAFTFFAGLLFGILYRKTGTLTAPIFFHGINNVMLVAILPYYFSGLLHLT